MLNLKVDYKSLRALDRLVKSLEVAESRLKNRRQALLNIHKYVSKRWLENFHSGGSIYGGWARKSSWAAQEGTAKGLVGSSSRLISYFTSKVQEQNLSNSDLHWIFENVPGQQYMVSHQEGYENPLQPPHGPRSAIPARILVDLNSEDEQKMEQIMERWVDQTLSRMF